MSQRLRYAFITFPWLALAAIGFAFASGSAIAEESDVAIEEVVVEAPIVVERVGQTAYGAEIEIIELKRRVKYTDLDLSKHADVMTLEKRVETVAKESCDMLYENYRFEGNIEKRRCVDKAIASAEDQVEAAVVAAN